MKATTGGQENRIKENLSDGKSFKMKATDNFLSLFSMADNSVVMDLAELAFFTARSITQVAQVVQVCYSYS